MTNPNQPPEDEYRLAAGKPGSAPEAVRPIMVPEESPAHAEPRILGMPEWVFYLLAGLALSPVFTLTPYLRIVGWVLSAVVHEAGHTLFAWSVGCPALPALSLQGHGAATIHYTQSRVFCFMVWAALGWLAWYVFRNTPDKRLRTLMVVLMIAYPFLAFNTTFRQMGHLLSGHLGELLVAGIFLWRARTGLFTDNELERLLYACVGWYLVFSNAFLCFGIAFVPAIRSWYFSHGSYGLTNDYVRAAKIVLHVNIRWIVLPMMLVAIGTGPLAIWLGRGQD